MCGRTELTTEALGTGIARAGKEKSSTAQVTHTKVDGAVENLRVSAHTPGPAAASKATSIKAEAKANASTTMATLAVVPSLFTDI